MTSSRLGLRSILAIGILLLWSLTPGAQAQAINPGTPNGHQSGVAADSAAVEGQEARLDEVVVTATRQGATELQKTPIAVSVFSANNLDQTGSDNIKDLAGLAPNVTFAQSSLNALIYIRGIGTNLIFAGSDPDVTTQLDGVYLARSAESFGDYLDVDRVEILRGPQGTLYGRNAVGGVVNINSRQPSDDFVAKEEVTVGNYGLFQNSAYASGAIVKGVLDASISTNYIEHDGYNKNLVAGGPNTDGANHGGVRVQLRWMPTDRIDATTRMDYNQSGEILAGYDHILSPVPFPAPIANSTIGQYHTIALNDWAYLDETTGGVAEDINFKFADNLSLKSLTAYRALSTSTLYDLDATELTVNNIAARDHSDQVSQEFDLTGHAELVDYVTGLYYFDETDSNVLVSEYPPSVVKPAPASLFIEALPVAQSKSKAVFAQGIFHATSTLNLTVGARYTEDNKDLQVHTAVSSYAAAPAVGPVFPGFPFIARVDPTFSAFTPKASIDWQVTENALLYFTYAQGYKSGGSNATATSLHNISFEPEKLTSYEVGSKTEWLDHRLRLNLTGFYYDYTNMQVQSQVSSGVSSTTNAASAKSKGVEFEAVARPIPQVLITANAGFLDAKYGTFTTASVPVALVPFIRTLPEYSAANGTYNASGNTLNSAPRFTYALTSQYTQQLPAGEMYGFLQYHWQDRVFYDPSNAPILSQGAYGVVDVAVGYHSPDSVWSVELLAKNVLDRNYWLTVAANSIVPSAVSGAPRTAVLRVSRNF